MRQISLRKFSTAECLLGLVTAEDLDLATTGDHLLQFINKYPGEFALQERLSDDLYDAGIVFNAEEAAPLERLTLICDYIKQLDVESQRRILKSFDPSSFTKKELVDLVRNKIEDVEKSYISDSGLCLYKDHIECGPEIIGNMRDALFFPQHHNKLE